jgi:sulfur relay (sulfurtransferase) complex TusBCD TusD component (DsrE family)
LAETGEPTSQNAQAHLLELFTAHEGFPSVSTNILDPAQEKEISVAALNMNIQQSVVVAACAQCLHISIIYPYL